MPVVDQPPAPVEDQSGWRPVFIFFAEYMMLFDGLVTVERKRLSQRTDSFGRVIVDINRLSVPERPPYNYGGSSAGGGPWIEVVVYISNAAAAGIVGTASWKMASASFADAIRRGRSVIDQIRYRNPQLPKDIAIDIARLAVPVYTEQLLRRKASSTDFRIDEISLSSKARDGNWIITFREEPGRPGLFGANWRRSINQHDHDPLVFEVRIPARPESWNDLRVSVRVKESQIHIRLG